MLIALGVITHFENSTSQSKPAIQSGSNGGESDSDIDSDVDSGVQANEDLFYALAQELQGGSDRCGGCGCSVSCGSGSGGSGVDGFGVSLSGNPALFNTLRGRGGVGGGGVVGRKGTTSTEELEVSALVSEQTNHLATEAAQFAYKTVAGCKATVSEITSMCVSSIVDGQ